MNELQTQIIEKLIAIFQAAKDADFFSFLQVKNYDYDKEIKIEYKNQYILFHYKHNILDEQNKAAWVIIDGVFIGDVKPENPLFAPMMETIENLCHTYEQKRLVEILNNLEKPHTNNEKAYFDDINQKG